MARRAGTSAAADDRTPEARPWGRARRGARCGHRLARAGGGNPGACRQRQPAPDRRGAPDTEAGCRREALRHRACQRGACADGGVARSQPSLLPLVAARRVAFPLSRGRISRARWSAAAKILAVSEAARKQLLAAGLADDRIEIVADGVEIPGTIPTETREKARQRWGFAAGEIVMECVAALTPEKGHALLIEAFAKLRRGPEAGSSGCC